LATTGNYHKNLANWILFFSFTIWRICFFFFYEKSFVEVEIIFFRSIFLEILSIKEMLVEENSYAYSLREGKSFLCPLLKSGWGRGGRELMPVIFDRHKIPP
jgi:hypothetical protein